MSTLFNYTPDKFTVSFKGVNITGFQDGTFIEVERDEDGFTKHVGALGDVTRVRNLNRAGKVTITLIQAAPTNDQLSAIASSDEQFGDGVGALLIKDLNGTTRVSSAEAWIQKWPKVERGKESLSVVWVIECAVLTMSNVGGNVT